MLFSDYDITFKADAVAWASMQYDSDDLALSIIDALGYTESEVTSSTNVIAILNEQIEENNILLSKTIRLETVTEDIYIFLGLIDEINVDLSDYAETNVPIYSEQSLGLTLNIEPYIDVEINSNVNLFTNVVLSFLEKDMRKELSLYPSVNEDSIENFIVSDDSIVTTAESQVSYYAIQETTLKVFDGTDWVVKINPIYTKQSDGTWKQALLKTKQADGSWQ